MAVVRDVLEAIHERRTTSKPDSDLFGTFAPTQLTPPELAAGVTPVSFAYQRYEAERFGFSESQGGVANAASLNNSILAASSNSGARRNEVILPAGSFNIDGVISWPQNVCIRGRGTQATVLLDQSSTGNLLDATGGLFNQSLRFLTINGAGASGSRRALYIKGGNRTMINQVNFSGYTAVSDGTYAVFMEGAGYQVVYDHCHWTSNKRHLAVQRTGTAGTNPGAFPTMCGWSHCLWEETTETGGIGCLFKDTSGMWLFSPTFQSNTSIYTVFVVNDADAETGCDFLMSGRVWMEQNGNGDPASIGVYLQGVSGHPLAGATIEGLRVHGSAVFPRYSIWAEYTDGLRVRDVGGGLGTSGGGVVSEFVHDGGNNLNWDIDWRGATDLCQLKSEIGWASANFNGKGGISVTNSRNLTVTRTGAGSYLGTFVKQPPAIGYVVLGMAEDNSTVGGLLFATGATTSTASFTFSTQNPVTGALTDGRTICVEVLAYPA